MNPICQRCQAATPASGIAFICTHECTFCVACAQELTHVCPNCSGELVRRPRPANASATDSQPGTEMDSD